ncbi:LuxR C-terminal-related transcriptional regulator [Rugosimonospora africana]|uniref:HTH luxR-type domain-containing protein n=1 Tax=Rugosimonospora africana TaxID=556532 RepID=A0A8J3VRB0_9ACTN|nr:hypothetical protein Raf01_41720 [Rugosimonospora africana]
MLVLSRYVDVVYATALLEKPSGIGYLLKDRVRRVDEFVDALNRVASGGTALDPEVVVRLLTHRSDPLAALTRREREILALMAEGHGNATIASRLVITDNAVHKHIGNIFSKLGLAPTDSGHRRGTHRVGLSQRPELTASGLHSADPCVAGTPAVPAPSLKEQCE